uniref:Ribosomal protein/NADH dehydrogenase domain-containing protein n=1 Tax=Globodera rostochiensis TaxID=31243 RepID=A0A914HY16_GLORO
MASPLQRLVGCRSPQIGFIVDRIRFVPHFEQLSVSWTANSPMSEGVERFVKEYWPIIRENNPNVQYRLARSYTECDPFIVGTFQWNRLRKQRLCWKHPHQILAIIEQWSIGGDYRPGRKRKVATIIPRGLQILDTETKGHEVFKVFSRWKGEPTGDTLDPKKHPHYLYKAINACRK